MDQEIWPDKEAVEAKREELRTLLEVDIPKTLKGINAAAAEGDLRENFEYHMLRDRQVMKRRLREGWEFFSFMARRRHRRAAEAP